MLFYCGHCQASSQFYSAEAQTKITTEKQMQWPLKELRRSYFLYVSKCYIFKGSNLICYKHIISRKPCEWRFCIHHVAQVTHRRWGKLLLSPLQTLKFNSLSCSVLQHQVRFRDHFKNYRFLNRNTDSCSSHRCILKEGEQFERYSCPTQLR